MAGQDAPINQDTITDVLFLLQHPRRGVHTMTIRRRPEDSNNFGKQSLSSFNFLMNCLNLNEFQMVLFLLFVKKTRRILGSDCMTLILMLGLLSGCSLSALRVLSDCFLLKDEEGLL